MQRAVVASHPATPVFYNTKVGTLRGSFHSEKTGLDHEAVNFVKHEVTCVKLVVD